MKTESNACSCAFCFHILGTWLWLLTHIYWWVGTKYPPDLLPMGNLPPASIPTFCTSEISDDWQHLLTIFGWWVVHIYWQVGTKYPGTHLDLLPAGNPPPASIPSWDAAEVFETSQGEKLNNCFRICLLWSSFQVVKFLHSCVKNCRKLKDSSERWSDTKNPSSNRRKNNQCWVIFSESDSNQRRVPELVPRSHFLCSMRRTCSILNSFRGSAKVSERWRIFPFPLFANVLIFCVWAVFHADSLPEKSASVVVLWSFFLFGLAFPSFHRRWSVAGEKLLPGVELPELVSADKVRAEPGGILLNFKLGSWSLCLVPQRKTDLLLLIQTLLHGSSWIDVRRWFADVIRNLQKTLIWISAIRHNCLCVQHEYTRARGYLRPRVSESRSAERAWDLQLVLALLEQSILANVESWNLNQKVMLVTADHPQKIVTQRRDTETFGELSQGNRTSLW